MHLSLNGEWRLSYRPETPIPQSWETIPAQVPGHVELDLQRAGRAPDPFWGENLYGYRKYEFYEWRFEREFDMPTDAAGERLMLTLGGVNLYAQVSVNGRAVGTCENMLIEQSFDVTEVLRFGEPNTVCVHIRSAMNQMRGKDFPVLVGGNDGTDEYVWQRKPPHSFGWDIMPRFPSAGLWRGVWLESVPATRLTQVYYATLSATEEWAELLCKVRFETDDPFLEGLTLRVTGDGFCVERPAMFLSCELRISVPHPRLWWPHGYGKAELYSVRMELLKDGRLLSARSDRIGIRQVDVDCKFMPGDAGEFLIKVNGCPILAKGSNWVPLDAMHSRDADRYDRALALFAQSGCNIVRCWGGNVYEDHRFFDLCDELGLLVWQDFTMACALYPQTDEFLQIIEAEAVSVIRKLRNHPCIFIWAGDNECDDAYVWRKVLPGANRFNAITRQVLPRAVRMNDPYRPFLPSSPYIPDGQSSSKESPEQHTWGARAYFKDDAYRHVTAHFISECGYHGCPAPESLARFIPAEQLWPYQNSVWRTHCTEYLPQGLRGYDRNQLMADQVAIFFGQVPETLEEFSTLSQVVQAEAKKYFIESTRIKKWRRTGIIWWNMLDGWPQISDAVVDYYFVKKRAFSYICRVQQPVCLMVDELTDWTQAVVLGNDSRTSVLVRYTVRDGETDETLLKGEILSPANENVTVGSVRVLAGQQRLLLLEWEMDGKHYGNHYITGYPTYDKEKVKGWLQRIDALPLGEST